MVLEPAMKVTNNPTNKMARIVKLITKLGPDINLIARMTGTYKETLRYWYRGKIIATGMAVQAVPNEAVLGFKRVAVRVRVSEMFLPHIRQTFFAMNDLSYAAAFELTVPDEHYVLHATIPERFIDDYKGFILKLKELGVFETVEFYDFDWFRRVPMRADHYDFDAGRWDYDWQNPVEIEKEEMEARPAADTKFEKTDLLLLKELQLDADRPLTEINRAILAKNNVKINYKTLQWHYRHHLVDGGLINGYSIRWMGTRYNPVAEKVEHRQHKYLVVDLIVKDVTRNEVLELTGKMHQTPFLWSEMAGKDYLGQSAFPIEATMDALQYLRGVMHPYGNRASFYVVDQKSSGQFVVPYNLWDDAEKEWTFAKEDILPRFENLVLKIRNGSGTVS